MIKKLDQLILKAFIGPFLATFLVCLFVLVMQFLWLYIDDLVGKGLDFFTIVRLLGLYAASMVPLALPLALLLSSIMTFGNLGESFELVAIKSAGIPLLRFMQPLFVVAICIAAISFVFANNIIPVANLKLNALKYDIIVSKPAFDIKEGIFYDKIEGFVIKIGKKEKDDSTIRNVVIYERNYGLQDFMMVAESGVMRVTADKKFLEFTLKNGWRYEEKGPRYSTNTEFIRLGFKEYKKVLDLSSFKMNKTEDSLFRYDPKMLSVRQLNQAIDSLHDLRDQYVLKSDKEINPYFAFARWKDSTWSKPVERKKIPSSIKNIIADTLLYMMYDRAVSQINTARSYANIIAEEYAAREKSIRAHEIEWHRKFTLSFACLVLFAIGAPLGSIIRKGGLGSPLVFAIIFFVVFHLLNTFGEKLVKEAVLSPTAGMWLSTVVLIPVGIFLTYKAMRDSQLFNQEFYFRLFKQISNRFQKN